LVGCECEWTTCVFKEVVEMKLWKWSLDFGKPTTYSCPAMQFIYALYIQILI
jgi:hypothetical protein